MALVVFALVQPLPGVAGIWLRVLVITAAFDVTYGVSWHPWWRTGLRALAALAVSVLIQHQMARETDTARSLWTLLMAMNFGAFQMLLLVNPIKYNIRTARSRS